MKSKTASLAQRQSFKIFKIYLNLFIHFVFYAITKMSVTSVETNSMHIMQVYDINCIVAHNRPDNQGDSIVLKLNTFYKH